MGRRWFESEVEAKTPVLSGAEGDESRRIGEARLILSVLSSDWPDWNAKSD